jgi:hypothetical protein
LIVVDSGMAYSPVYDDNDALSLSCLSFVTAFVMFSTGLYRDAGLGVKRLLCGAGCVTTSRDLPVFVFKAGISMGGSGCCFRVASVDCLLRSAILASIADCFASDAVC